MLLPKNLEIAFKEENIEFTTSVAQLKSNITEFSAKNLLGKVLPKNKSEVEKIVSIANWLKIVLYPYSSGMNWGQGSKIPTHDNSLLVDLSLLNNIIELNEKHRYVIIEPGVTQQQLYEALEGTQFKIPVTGSSKNSSVIGNMLERGATFFGHRNKLLMGVEAILGNESTIRTGLWHFHKEDTDAIIYHAQGLGPDMNGLFTQSNFGIVTKVVLRLLPKKEGSLVHIEAKETNLIPLIDTLYKLWEDNILQDGILITNKNDPRTTVKGSYSYTGDWFAVAAISGSTNEILQANLSAAKEFLSPICYHLDFLPTDSESTENHPYFSILNKLYHGEPTNYSLQTMAEMQNIEMKDENDLDANKDIIGFSVALPAVPFDGEQVWQVMQVVKKVSDKLGVQPFHNFGSINDKVFEGFYRIYFDRKDEDAIATAHIWNKEVHAALEKIGIFPYRMNIERMSYFTNDSEDTFWQTVGNIKTVLDPNNVIAKGRYSPR